MKTAIILHGTMSSSTGNWFQWLKSELETNGYHVWAPDLPRPELPSLKEWTDFIFDNVPFPIDRYTLVVGHSSGAVAALFVGQLSEHGVGQSISIGAYKDLTYLHEKLDFHLNDRFFDIAFDFEKVKQNISKITFVHSDDDPYCPLSQAEFLAEKTGGNLVIMAGQGHFNLGKSSAYKEFPALLRLI